MPNFKISMKATFNMLKYVLFKVQCYTLPTYTYIILFFIILTAFLYRFGNSSLDKEWNMTKWATNLKISKTIIEGCLIVVQFGFISIHKVFLRLNPDKQSTNWLNWRGYEYKCIYKKLLKLHENIENTSNGVNFKHSIFILKKILKL